MKAKFLLCRSAIAKMVAATIVIIVVVGIAGAAYYLTLPPPSPSPSPTQTPTPKPTPTPSPTPTSTPTPTPTPKPTPSPTPAPTPTPQPTPTPTPTPAPTPTPYPAANWRVGAYANYVMEMKMNETLSVNGTMKMSLDRVETYNETLCWVLPLTMEISLLDYGTMKQVMTMWLSKDDLSPVHVRMQTYVNDTLTNEQEIDPTQPGTTFTLPPYLEPVDPQTIVGYETVTVAAGTFVNCTKHEIKTVQDGVTTVIYAWEHPDASVWALVKMDMYSNDKLMGTFELVSYGG